MIPSIVRRLWFTDAPTVYMSEAEGDPFAYFSWLTTYRNRPVQLLFGLCPTQPPTEITALLSAFDVEQINDTVLWISEDEKAILYYVPTCGYLEWTYHPSLKSFEGHLAMLCFYATKDWS